MHYSKFYLRPPEAARFPSHLNRTISPALFNDQFSRKRLPTTELIFEVGVAAKHLAVLEGNSGFAEEAKCNNNCCYMVNDGAKTLLAVSFNP